jgi:hypothetical protein
MKNFQHIVSLSLLVIFASSFILPNNFVRVILDSNSEVFISGTSNVNSFNCYYNTAKLKNPIPVNFENYNDKIIFHSAILELENSYFDCGHRGINKDFNKLLQTDIYPSIKIQLLSLESIQESDKAYRARVIIFIGNTHNNYEFPVSVTNNENIEVNGELKMNLCDFNLEAPKKVFGLITVNDVITVNFNLFLNTSIIN